MALESFDLEPSKENLIKTLSENLLDRNESIWHFARFCDAQDNKCSIALDAKWGYGKTFFVRHVQMLIEAVNNFTSAISEEERTLILDTFSAYSKSGQVSAEFEPEVCVYYDAWSNDNDNDPMLSLIYAIIMTSAQRYSLSIDSDILDTVALIAELITGKNVADFIEHRKQLDLLQDLRVQKETHEKISHFLDSLLPEKGNRLIVFVDELDRCKPTYAIRLLERIKHYFSNDRMTFVFSVNMNELQHSVKCVYGEGFDANRYLDRFFDYRIALPPANMTRYYQLIGLNKGSWVYEAVCKEVIKYCSFGIREINKYYRMAKTAAYTQTHSKFSDGFSDENAIQFSLMLVVPIVIGLHMYDSKLYHDFLDGKDDMPLIDILSNGCIGSGICSKLLSPSETFGEAKTGQKTVQLSDKLHEAYKAIFGRENNGGEIQIGDCLFSSQTKEIVLKASSLISEYAAY